DLAELPLLALQVRQVLLELADRRALEHCRQRVDVARARLRDDAFLADPLAPGLQQGVGEQAELLGHEVLPLTRLVAGDEEDVLGPEELVEQFLGLPELPAGPFELLGEELSGV